MKKTQFKKWAEDLNRRYSEGVPAAGVRSTQRRPASWRPGTRTWERRAQPRRPRRRLPPGDHAPKWGRRRQLLRALLQRRGERRVTQLLWRAGWPLLERLHRVSPWHDASSPALCPREDACARGSETKVLRAAGLIMARKRERPPCPLTGGVGEMQSVRPEGGMKPDSRPTMSEP